MRVFHMSIKNALSTLKSELGLFPPMACSLETNAAGFIAQNMRCETREHCLYCYFSLLL